jgi:hypothetical protein
MAVVNSPPHGQVRAINPGYRTLCPILLVSLAYSAFFGIPQIISSSLSGAESVPFVETSIFAAPHSGEVEQLNAEIESLQFQLDMQRVRQAPISGPISLKGLWKELSLNLEEI